MKLKQKLSAVHHIVASSAETKRGPSRVNLGSTWGQPGVNLHRLTLMIWMGCELLTFQTLITPCRSLMLTKVPGISSTHLHALRPACSGTSGIHS